MFYFIYKVALTVQFGIFLRELSFFSFWFCRPNQNHFLRSNECLPEISTRTANRIMHIRFRTYQILAYLFTQVSRFFLLKSMSVSFFNLSLQFYIFDINSQTQMSLFLRTRYVKSKPIRPLLLT